MKRRTFVKSSAAAGSFFILPSGLWADSPNGRICTAHIGVAGKGGGDLGSISSHPKVQVLGLCDVDKARAKPAKLLKKHTSAKFFMDYAAMLAELGDKIDAVSISTPDHTHHPATLAAMNLGKHVYTQKPLTRTLTEARQLMEVAREKQLVTQMGIQQCATLAYRTGTQFIQDGIIGKVRSVHVWSGKNWGYDGAPYTGEDPVPEGFDWKLWLGTAKFRPFLTGKYHPGQWRRMIDFGCGTLGDMGVHIFDTPFRALGLTAPRWAETTCRPPTGFGHPEVNTVRYGFDASALTTEGFTFTWYDGKGAPRGNEPDLQLPAGEKLPSQGAMFVGEEGRMLLPHTAGPRFYPRDLIKKITKPDLKPVNHYHQFVDAILGTTRTSADFDYAAPLTETLLLGTVAARFPGKKLTWDPKAMKITNLPDANKFL